MVWISTSFEVLAQQCLYCATNGKYYQDIGQCIEECKVTLGHFTGICSPVEQGCSPAGGRIAGPQAGLPSFFGSPGQSSEPNQGEPPWLSVGLFALGAIGLAVLLGPALFGLGELAGVFGASAGEIGEAGAGLAELGAGELGEGLAEGAAEAGDVGAGEGAAEAGDVGAGEGAAEAGDVGAGEGAAEAGDVGAGEGAAEAGDVGAGAEGAAETGDVGAGAEGAAEAGDVGAGAEGAAEAGDVGAGAEGAAEGGEVGAGAEGAAEGGEVGAGEGTAGTGDPGEGGGRAFYGTPQGTLIEAPPGYEPVPAQNGQGLVLKPEGQSLGNNSNIIRWGEPNARYPDGYFRYYNDAGQPLNPRTGQPGPNSLTYISPDYYGPLKGYPGR